MNMKMTLAAMGLIAVASQANTLWSLSAADFQVQVPCVTSGVPPIVDNNADGAYDTYDCAGWWYGYGFGPAGATVVGTWAPATATGELMTTNPLDGTVIPGGNLTATGLKITLTTPAGSQDAPMGAGLGFDYANPKAAVDISAHSGYCITYTSDAALNVELGWDEATNGYDAWFTTIPVSATSKTLDLPWTGAAGAATAGVWKKDAWETAAAHMLPITAAQTGAYSLKIVLKNNTTAAKTANFEIQELGWVGDCTGPSGTIGSAAKSSLNANLSGRSLAFSGFGKKSVTAEVISIQGQVVARQVVSAASATVDLSKVAAGVYVVKASGKGLSMNKMIAIK